MLIFHGYVNLPGGKLEPLTCLKVTLVISRYPLGQSIKTSYIYIYVISDLDIGGNYEYSPFEYPETGVGK